MNRALGPHWSVLLAALMVVAMPVFAAVPAVEGTPPEAEPATQGQVPTVIVEAQAAADKPVVEADPGAMARIRALMPDLTDAQVRNLAIAAGAIYLLPGNNQLIGKRNVKLSPSIALSLDKVVTWGAYIGIAYLVLDPFNPNWEIEQAAFPKQTYQLSLRMKRYYAGGAGEAYRVFEDRAKELMRQGGYDGYTVVEYSEGMDSSVLGSQRVARGVIRLTRADG